MLLAAGRNQDSAYPSLSSKLRSPCRWIVCGTGPVYGGGVLLNTGSESRPLTPPGGFAQCSVGSTVVSGDRNRLLPSTSWFRHVTRVCLLTLASMVQAGECAVI